MFRGAILAGILASTVYGLMSYLIFMGAFKSNFQHYPGTCKGRKHLISTGTHGVIQLFDFKDPDAGVTELKIAPSKEFDIVKMRPHGITLQEDKVKGEHILYIINHPAQEQRELVEKFKFRPSTRQLTHLKSFELDGSNFFNNIATSADNKFYISNYAYMPSKGVAGHLLTDLFPIRLGGLYFYNGTEAVAVTPNIVTPNGVILCKDKRYLYAVITMEQSLYVYQRETITNRLMLKQKVFLGVKGDNLNLTPNGDALLLPSHPVFYKMLFHLLWALSPEYKSPSSVLRIPLGADGLVQETAITELFYDHGDLISGSSAAAAHSDQLLIGSVANSLVHCQLKLEV